MTIISKKFLRMIMILLKTRDSNPFKSSDLPKSGAKPMAISPTDKGNEFIESGMTLITQISSEKYLQKQKKTKQYDIPKDRYSRPCGGAGGFDDFVERWHE